MSKYERIVHFSKASRRRGHPGGVEKFAMYLAGCADIDVLTPEDDPDLNDPKTLYIVDNHWGLQVGEGCRVICVLHGCAADQGFNRPIGRLQKKMARRPNTRFISNSRQTQELCRKHYRVDSEWIHLAVDESLYFPPMAHSGTVVLTTTAGKTHKGARVLNKVKGRQPPEVQIVDLDCPLGEEGKAFRSADGFILLSKHEGFAYSVLEAMSANLPVVTGPHGIGYELQGSGVITVLPERKLWDASVVTRALLEALAGQSRARQWVLEHCSLELFKQRWLRVLAEELDAPPPPPVSAP